MGKNCGAELILRYSILLIFVLSISACAVKLIDIDRSLPKLNLSGEQLEVVEPKMMAIKELSDEYNIEKEEFEEEISTSMEEARSSGDRSQLRGKFQEVRSKHEVLLKKRESYLSAIKIHIADIKAVLNKEQLAAFEKMELPELEEPETPGGGRRPGFGGREGGGRPRGAGGGDRRGGGVF